MEDKISYKMTVTEFNHFGIVDGKLMVTRLDLYTDGGNMPRKLYTRVLNLDRARIIIAYKIAPARPAILSNSLRT